MVSAGVTARPIVSILSRFFITIQGWGANLHITNPKTGEADMYSQAFEAYRMDFTWAE